MNRFWKRSVTYALVLAVTNVTLMPSTGATLISTEQVAEASTSTERARISALLARPEIQAELIRRGVSPGSAAERVSALTDEEVRTLAGRLDQPAAGASDVLGALLVVFIVLLVTDILGFTKVFSFTRSVK